MLMLALVLRDSELTAVAAVWTFGNLKSPQVILIGQQSLRITGNYLCPRQTATLLTDSEAPLPTLSGLQNTRTHQHGPGHMTQRTGQSANYCQAKGLWLHV